MIVAKKFQMFDYGSLNNYYEYGDYSPNAVLYSEISVPMAIFVGERDMLADKEDNDVFTSNI